MYVENGLAAIKDCNISGNALTGISAISTDEARLHIEDSDVRGKIDQIRWSCRVRPPVGVSIGIIPSRVSELDFWKESSRLDGSRGAREPSTPQSPL